MNTNMYPKEIAKSTRLIQEKDEPVLPNIIRMRLTGAYHTKKDLFQISAPLILVKNKINILTAKDKAI